MNQLPASVTKYLNKYADNRRHTEAPNYSGIKNIVVIPAMDEFENIKLLLSSISKCDKKYFHSTLFLFVINNFITSTELVKENNRQSLVLLRSLINRHIEDAFVAGIKNSGMKLSLVDASSNGNEMPEKVGGVGLARKIGMDLALTIFDYSNPLKNILICLDADCTVSYNYLTSIVDNFNNRRLEAASLYFEHSLTSDYKTASAIICYEIFLRYYVLGLTYSNSYIAFHT
ncbi:MAG: hypothetical protein K8H86_03705, partial [Ignavibacteriaceae bacterium]|nr:hypothetical protein [Ignavibacteriaceae bacterium]